MAQEINKELNKEIYERLFDICEYLSQHSKNDSISLVHSTNTGSYSSRWGRSSGWQSWITNRFPTPALFIGTAQQAILASVLGLVPNDMSLAVITVEQRELFEGTDYLDNYQKLASLAYDVTAPDSKIGEHKVVMAYGREHTMPSFTGELDPTFVLSYTKAAFVSSMSEYWQKNFLMDDWGRHNALRTIGRSKALARAMTLGSVDIYVPSGRGTGSKLSSVIVSFLTSCNITVTSDDERVTKSLDTLQKTRDYAMLWQKQADDRHMAIRISEETLNDEDATMSIFKQAAETFDMDVVLRAYELGVPAEDLVA